eukprot:3933280-Rhodomonas_salina.1
MVLSAGDSPATTESSLYYTLCAAVVTSTGHVTCERRSALTSRSVRPVSQCDSGVRLAALAHSTG